MDSIIFFVLFFTHLNSCHSFGKKRLNNQTNRTWGQSWAVVVHSTPHQTSQQQLPRNLQILLPEQLAEIRDALDTFIKGYFPCVEMLLSERLSAPQPRLTGLKWPTHKPSFNIFPFPHPVFSRDLSLTVKRCFFYSLKSTLGLSFTALKVPNNFSLHYWSLDLLCFLGPLACGVF